MMEQRTEILLVDDDPDVVWNLGRDLVRAGFSVTTTGDVQDAISLLAGHEFDFVVTDLALPRSSGLEIIDWVMRNCPGTRAVAITALGSPMIRELTLAKGAVQYFEKPVNAGLLIEVLSAPNGHSGFWGAISEIDLIDYLQLLFLSAKRVLVEVCSTDGLTGLLFVDSGTVLHAQRGDLVGEEALYQCVALREGSFRSVAWREPEVFTIDQQGDYLLFEAARRRDDLADPS
jgi:CheY-like chemotaxis protein